MELDKKIVELIIDEVILFHDTNNMISKKMKEDFINNILAKVSQMQLPVKPEIADTTNITMWVDMIWNDIFDDDELDFNPRQMNIIGKYVNDAKEKIRKQFSV